MGVLDPEYDKSAVGGSSSFLDQIQAGGGVYNSITRAVGSNAAGSGSTIDLSPLSPWTRPAPPATQRTTTPGGATQATVAPRTSFSTSSVSTPTLAVAQPKAPTSPALPALALPQFSMPERDERREKFLTSQASRPGLARLDQALTRALGMGQNVDNPVARAEHARRTIEGYAGGVADVMGAAGNQGRAAYGAERAEDISEAQTNFSVSQANAQAAHQAEVQKIMADFDLATRTYLVNLQDYLTQPLGQRGATGATGIGTVGGTTWRNTGVPGILSRA